MGLMTQFLCFPLVRIAPAKILTGLKSDLLYMNSTMSRLTKPLVRENGTLRLASWDEALDRAADGFRHAKSAYGGRSFGLFSCSKTTNEMNFMAQKFARAVMSSNNVDSCNRT
jgi:formate dehydrogenase (hydrogenase)